MRFIICLLLTAPFAFFILLVRLELEVVAAVFLALDVEAFLTAVLELSVKDLILAELALKRAIEESVLS